MEGLKSRILRLYLSFHFSKETEERVQRWMIREENIEETEQASYRYWEQLEAKAEAKDYASLERVKAKIGQGKPGGQTPLYKQFLRIAAVLIPLMLLTGGYLYYLSGRNNESELSAAYGEEKHLFLPDRSEVWVNSGSTLRYPKEFGKDRREIYLEGEAYFSVTKDTQKPFIVHTRRLDVKVLGTKFNVKAYDGDEHTITTLTSGKVEIRVQDSPIAVLKPDEQLLFNNQTGQDSIKTITREETTAWMDGHLVFADASPREIFRTLERKFGLPFKIENSVDFGDKRYTVKFLKKESLNEILTILKEVIGGFSYQIEKDRVVIRKKD